MSELKSTGLLMLPAEKVTKGDFLLGLVQTSLCSRLSRLPHKQNSLWFMEKRHSAQPGML
jgi:hypothetical protein